MSERLAKELKLRDKGGGYTTEVCQNFIRNGFIRNETEKIT